MKENKVEVAWVCDKNRWEITTSKLKSIKFYIQIKMNFSYLSFSSSIPSFISCTSSHKNMAK
jgi:hypothetical protein